jgi:hypothetical protein
MTRNVVCARRNIFGAPGTGVHSYRILNLAIVDVIFTIAGAFLLSYFARIQFYKSVTFLFVIGVLLHRFFCVNTTINKLIFGEI